MRAFSSGGCGQVGSHIAELLLDRCDTVLAIDNLATGRLEHLVPQQRLTFVEGSIVDRPLVGKLIGEFKPDVLIHTAASYKDPDDWYNDTLR
jgi:nucleoside-diphosphate-sugar epimerase